MYNTGTGLDSVTTRNWSKMNPSAPHITECLLGTLKEEEKFRIMSKMSELRILLRVIHNKINRNENV
jgi:hypothetical protein